MSDEFAVVAHRLFTGARTHNQWLAQEVPPALLRGLYDLVKHAPTTMNSQPMRLLFVMDAAAKERLSACVNPANVAKIQRAPVVAVVGQDMAFADRLPELFPHNQDAKKVYEGKPDMIASTALRNSSLQGGYLIMAARLLGLDCGPMSGFNAAAVDQECWAGTTVKTNFICCLGYGDATKLMPKGPRLSFEEACRLI